MKRTRQVIAQQMKVKNQRLLFFVITVCSMTFGSSAYSQELKLSSNMLDFGIRDTSQAPASQTVYIKNTGSNTLTIDSLSSPSAPFSLLSLQYDSITANDSTALELACNNSLTPGLYESTVTVFSNAGDSVVHLSVQLSWPAQAFTFDDITDWVGSGNQKAMLVIDFHSDSTIESYAWGYRFNNAQTAENMLTNIAAADSNLEVVINSGFLNDIIYKNHSGLGGAPNYWSTWSGTGLHNWQMNFGLTTSLQDSSWFGCSYTDFMPALIPRLPQAASYYSSVAQQTGISKARILPNPVSDVMIIQTNDNKHGHLSIFNINGQKVHSQEYTSDKRLNVSGLKPGMYILTIEYSDNYYRGKFQKL